MEKKTIKLNFRGMSQRQVDAMAADTIAEGGKHTTQIRSAPESALPGILADMALSGAMAQPDWRAQEEERQRQQALDDAFNAASAAGSWNSDMSSSSSDYGGYDSSGSYDSSSYSGGYDF